MRTRFLTLVLACWAFGSIAASLQTLKKVDDDVSGPYEVVADWPQIPRDPGFMQGSGAGCFAESPNRIFVVTRGELKIPLDKLRGNQLPAGWNGSWGAFHLGPANSEKPAPPPVNGQTTGRMHNAIVVVDAGGKVLEAWTQWDSLFVGSGHPEKPGRQFGPHSAAISPYDPEHNVWILDDKTQQLFKFSNDGRKLLLTIGVRQQPGTDPLHIGGSTDIAWLPDGTFFLSDGYDNSRVAKYDKDGKFLTAWGKAGKAPGEFNLPHSIAVDRNRRVFVADRGNNRIQVFDENGKSLEVWAGIDQPSHIMITADQHLIVGTLNTNKMLKYELTGKLVSSWGTTGNAAGQLDGIHGFCTDTNGVLMVSETFGGRIQRFTPKPGADKNLLIGAPQALMPKSSS
jgi:DNA-binding beta-propeller fold protein YncE